MKENFIFPAFFKKTGDQGMEISFPDLGITFFSNEKDAIVAAQQFLASTLVEMEERGEVIPSPSIIPGTILVNVWLPFHRQPDRQVFVKKTVTIPDFLDKLGKEHNVNFSALLSQALKDKFGID